MILKGVEIGEGSIVGAGSVVVKSLPPYTIAVGNPCKPMKKVFSDVDLVEHLGLLGMKDKDIVDTLERRKNGFN